MTLANLEDIRDDFGVGEEVLVERRQYGGKVSGAVIRGTIVRKEGKFAMVRVGTKGPRAVQKVPYKRLKKTPPIVVSPPPKLLPEASKLRRSQVLLIAEPTPLRVVPDAFRKIHAHEPKPANATSHAELITHVDESTVVEQPATVMPSSEITTWLEMGAQLIEQFRAKCSALRDESKELAERAQKLMDRADEKIAEEQALLKQIELLTEIELLKAKL
jgi:hypothetical protein